MSCRVPPAALGDLPIHDWEAPISRLSFTIFVIILFFFSFLLLSPYGLCAVGWHDVDGKGAPFPCWEV